VGNIKAFAERIERLHDERDTLADDVRDIYEEAKGQNLNVKALKAAIAYRRKHRKDPIAAEKLEEEVHQYLFAIEHGTVPATRVRAQAVIEPASTVPAPVAQPSRHPVQAVASLPQQTPAEFYAAAAVEAQQVDHSDRNGCPAFLDRRV
jgi:uncharacterized protein (UPF0335 family)